MFKKKFASRRENAKIASDILELRQSGRFDIEFYLTHNNDVAQSGMDPIEHYVRHGAREGRNPSRDFDTSRYVETLNDSERWKINPMVRWLRAGAKPTVRILEATQGSEQLGVTATAPDIELLSAHFDEKYYLAQYPDVGRANIPCLQHFLKWGWMESRNPSESFNAAWYWVVNMLPKRELGNPLSHYILNNLGESELLRDAGRLHASDQQNFESAVVGLLEDGWLDEKVLRRLARACDAVGLIELSEIVYRDLLSKNWDLSEVHYLLASSLSRQGKWWQSVNSLQVAITIGGEKPKWLLELARAKEMMRDFEGAMRVYQTVLPLIDAEADHYYSFGYCAQQSGHLQISAGAYNSAVQRDKKLATEKFGIGAFHQARGRWADAAQAYEDAANSRGLDAYLHYRAGFANERCYRWAQAAKYYEIAIALETKVAYWHSRLAFVYERNHQFGLASEAYRKASLLSKTPVKDYLYWSGYCIGLQGDKKRGCSTIISCYQATEELRASLVRTSSRFIENDNYSHRLSAVLVDLLSRDELKDSQSAAYYKAKAQQEGRLCNWSNASEFMCQAVMRSNEHDPEAYALLCFYKLQIGEIESAWEAALSTRRIRRNSGVVEAAQAPTEAMMDSAVYADYYEVLPVKKGVLVYESMHGTSVGGNPYAIYKELCKRSEFDHLIHVWVLDRDAKSPRSLRSCKNTIIVSRGSDLYLRYLASAEYLINDVTFPSWFIRKDGQKYLNTWHGTPLKKMGEDIVGEYFVHGNVSRNFLQATHLIFPNDFTAGVMTRAYGINDIASADCAVTGYPRVDVTTNGGGDISGRLREQLGLSGDAKIVLYAPTWRGDHGSSQVDEDRLHSDLLKLCGHGYEVLFRGHQLVEKMIASTELPVTLVPQSIDANELLAITDVLITDYSSIFFDFLCTGRPILFYAYDLLDYSHKRGLYLEYSSMPGEVCTDVEQVVRALDLITKDGWVAPESYAKFRSIYANMDDGCASKRVVDFFFGTHVRCSVQSTATTCVSSKSLLAYGGHFIPNGITSSFINLVSAVVEDKLAGVTVAIDAGGIGLDSKRKRKLECLRDKCNFVPRTAGMVKTIEEIWVDRYTSGVPVEVTADMSAVLGRAYGREFLRLFGSAKIDAVVNFEGYSAYWMKLFAYSPVSRRVAYLHSDMMKEYQVRLPYLHQIFLTYANYSTLVCVSPAVEHSNRNALAGIYVNDAATITSCPNVLNVVDVRNQAKLDLDVDVADFIGRDNLVFITIGRLSIEKDHKKLLEAFKCVATCVPRARLLLLGDGPLRQELEGQVIRDGMSDRVLLAGARDNPFPALAASDCFVLSSNHEGQPMVLLEAMCLEKPVIATDIPGNRGVLHGYGELVENSVDGLKVGMKSFAESGGMRGSFDAEAYNKIAISSFSDLILTLQ